MQPTAILGDVHGDRDRMVELVGGIDPATTLVLVGDYFDRWNQGIEAVEWIMARPNTIALMGNHDALMLAVVEEVRRGEQGRAMESWLWNGGQKADLDRVLDHPEIVEWLEQLPAMVVVDGTLIQHCDSPIYLSYGGDVSEINRAFREKVASHDPAILFDVFADLCKRRQFYAAPDLQAYLQAFGVSRLVHGHTPHVQPEALSLFNGTIVNVDGALSRGFGTDRPRGFVFWLEPLDGTVVISPGSA